MIINIILAAEGLIILALLFYVYRQHIASRSRKRMFSAHMMRVKKLYTIMGNYTQETGIENILIFKTSNGGRKPEMGKPLSISAIYEGPGTDLIERYERVTVSEEDIRMLLDLKQEKSIKYRVEDIPFGVLKRLYMAEDRQHSCMFFINETEEDFFFGSIATKNENNPFDNTKIDVATALLIDQIRDIFKKLNI